MNTYLMKGYLDTIPKELDESQLEWMEPVIFGFSGKLSCRLPSQ